MKRFIFFCVSILIGLHALNAQTDLYATTTSDSLPVYDFPRLDTLRILKKDPWLAGAQVIGVNIGVWAFDRYILKGDYAYINLQTMKHNIRSGFYWDNDNFQTNLFSHPYHGSIYMNAGRSNGLNFWQSGLYAVGGSFMWEMFMERELPSTNDFIATPIGGAALGEVLFRASDWVIDDRTTGWERFGHEFACLVLSPARGLTRIINGDAWRRSSNRGRSIAPQPMSLYLGMGFKALELKNNILDRGVGLAVDLGFIYGDLYDSEDTKPYDYFTLRGSFNLQKKQPFLGRVNLIGRLWGKELYEKNNNELHFGLFQHFDYYASDTISDISNKKPYEIATPAAFGAGLIFRGKTLDETWVYNAHLHLNGILLGASISDYYFLDERGYNWGSGYGAKIGGSVSYKNKLSLTLANEHYHIFTWNGYDPNMDLSTVNFRTLNVQGDKSDVLFNISTLGLGYRFNQKWSIGASGTLFVRRTDYAYREDYLSITQENRLMAIIKF